MRRLDNVTLLGADCVDIDRLILASDICRKDFEFADVALLSSIPSPRPEVRAIEPLRSIKEYSEFMLKKVADHVNTEFVLIIQHDGFILNPDAWSEEFLAYDYIGAPWLIDGAQVVGNGGFSMRSRRLCALTQSDPTIQLGSKEPHKYAENEDWVISVIFREYLEAQGIRFAPAEVGHRFSLEQNEVYGGVWSGEFGFHGLRWTDIRPWLKEHPEYPIENPLDLV
jgi:hypothetical protein